MKISKHAHIEKTLKEMLDRLPPESKIPTEIELAKEFNVSRMTMNKVLSQLVNEGILYRVKRKGTFKKDKRTLLNPIYFLVPTWDFMTNGSSNFHKKLLSGALKEAKILGRKLEILPVNKTNNRDDWDWDAVNSIQNNSQVLIPSIWYKDLFHIFNERKCEAVIITGGIWLEEEYRKYLRSSYTIEICRKAGTENAVLHLAKNGRKRPLLVYEYEEKLHPIPEGYKSGIQQAGLKLDKDLMVFLPDRKLIPEIIKSRSKRNFDSVILSTHPTVIPALSELKKENLKIPDDISVICLENDSLFTETEIPVSTVASPLLEAGQEAVRIFNRDVFLPGETRLRQTLIERESTRKGAGNTTDPEYLHELGTNEEFNKIFNM